MTSIRTRFAPSPTGHLHLGNVRTALYNWLYARRHGGTFILRLEDTDQARSSEPFAEEILETMQWLGLDHDGPIYRQSRRLRHYHDVINQLCETGKAYRCHCSPERLANLREKQLKNNQIARYDGCCRDKHCSASPGSFVIRLRLPLEGQVTFHDQLLGSIVVHNSQLDDFILARSDGSPTYHLTVVVDDIDMRITHVIRGNDHVSNTSKQYHIFQALQASPPQYTHLPMVLDNHGKRLSKRHGAMRLLDYRDAGYLPQALCNHLLRLGWSHGDQEYFTRDAMIAQFDLQHLQKSPAKFDPQKLQWFNQQHLKQADPNTLVTLLKPFLAAQHIHPNDGPPLSQVIPLLQARSKTLVDMATASAFFYQKEITYDLDAKKQHITPDTKAHLTRLYDQLETVQPWSAMTIKACFHAILQEASLKFPQLAQPLRIALTGNTISPAIDQTVYLLGKECVQQRLANFLTTLERC